MNLEQKIIDKKFIGFKIKIDNGSIRKTFKSALKSTIVHNVVSLYLIQFANYIMPLIIIPYLVQVLGLSGYGTVSFAQGFINYLMLFVEYGFDWSATRKIATYKENHEMVNKIVFHVWAAKGLLALIGFIVLIALIILIPKMNEVKWIILLFYGQVLGNVLLPVWLFQGMEQMPVISSINLMMKLAILVVVFLLVKHSEDIFIYAGLVGIGAVASGLTGMIIAAKRFNLKAIRIIWKEVWKTLYEGWLLFLSKASVSLYTAGNSFILGMVTNYTVVGYYAPAERIVLALRGLVYPVAQAFFPRISQLTIISKKESLRLAKKSLLIMGSIGFISFWALFMLAPIIIEWWLGKNFNRSILVLRILSPWLFIEGITNAWGIQTMIPLGLDKEFFIIILSAGIINILISPLLSYFYQEIGMAISVLLSILFVAIMLPYTLYNKSGITPWLEIKK